MMSFKLSVKVPVNFYLDIWTMPKNVDLCVGSCSVSGDALWNSMQEQHAGVQI
jgi:hypothetical protein